MSSDDPLEIVVYGDAPEDEEESSTDTISIPADFLQYYVPVGPTIIHPIPPDGGGGGGDICNGWGEVEEKAMWIAAGFGVLGGALAVSGAGVVVGFGAVVVGAAFGVGSWYAGQADNDPPQPDYKRDAGSTIPVRQLALTGTPGENRAVETILGVERPTAVFVDAAECAQGAFLAGDATWTQRHTEAARAAFLDCGDALLGMADTLERIAGRLQPAGPAPDGALDQLVALLPDVRPVLDLSPSDEAHISEKMIAPASSRGVPTKDEIRSAVQAFRRLGQRMATPVMVDVRFAFVKTRPVAR